MPPLSKETEVVVANTTNCDTHSIIFQVLHADTMHMTPKSNGCGHIVHGHCGMSSWMEGRAVRDENGKAIAAWLFEDIIC